MFYDFIPLASDKKFDQKTKSVFVVHSRGFETARDAWVYNFSKHTALANMQRMVEFYNSQIAESAIDYDETKISWSSSLLNLRERRVAIVYQEDRSTTGLYRPFVKQWLYNGEKVIHRPGQFDAFFPTPDTENLVIAISGLGGNRQHSALISNTIIDLNCLDAGTQCFPLYYYEVAKTKPEQTDLFSSTPEYTRRDGISDCILQQAHQKYGDSITKEDIFYYVYGLLHSPGYRTAFADDLKKSLPRIPLVDHLEDFRIFAQTGRELARLHLNYEAIPPLKSTTVIINGEIYPAFALPPLLNHNNLTVQKMRYPAGGRKDCIIVNDHITVNNIPAEAYTYIINGRSAIEWVMDRYQVHTDKDSGIVNDPNLYATENGKPTYILRLLLSVITVSVRTMEKVNSLPELRFSKTENEESLDLPLQRRMTALQNRERIGAAGEYMRHKALGWLLHYLLPTMDDARDIYEMGFAHRFLYIDCKSMIEKAIGARYIGGKDRKRLDLCLALFLDRYGLDIKLQLEYDPSLAEDTLENDDYSHEVWSSYSGQDPMLGLMTDDTAKPISTYDEITFPVPEDVPHRHFLNPYATVLVNGLETMIYRCSQCGVWFSETVNRLLQ